jgi:hypothetical protein
MKISELFSNIPEYRQRGMCAYSLPEIHMNIDPQKQIVIK